MLFKLTPKYKDLVNLVYSTQSTPDPLTFEQATTSIRRLVSAESVGEGASSKGLLNRTKSGKIKKRKGKKNKDDSGCAHCKKPGHEEEKCWFKHPELAPDSFTKFLEAKKGDNQGDKKPNPIRASICRSRLLKATHWQPILSKKWFLDSGATDHMSNNKDALSNYKGFARPKDIQLGDDSIIKSYGSGTIRLGKITLKNVLYAPKLSLNLISVNTIA